MINTIPNDVLNEIDFMCGSIEECNADYLRPILERHGYNSEQFGFITPDEALITDIYKELFVTGIIKPFPTNDDFNRL